MPKSKNRKTNPSQAIPGPRTATTPVSSQPQPGPVPASFTSYRTDVIPLIQGVEKLRNSKVITYYLPDTAQISNDVVPSFYQHLRGLGKQERLDLWIHSRGGTTEVPWRIVQIIRAYCDNFGVLVPEVAHSAATHLALGANEIVMGAFSMLSPVDPTQQHPLSPQGPNQQPVPISVQDLKHAVDFIKREAGEEGLQGEAYSQVIAALMEKVHPLAIGAVEQSYALSKLITKRMLSTHMNEESEGPEIDRIADALCDDYMSHQFPIGLLELKRLGLKSVVDAPDDLYEAMWKLKEYYDGIDRAGSPLPTGVQIDGIQPQQGSVRMYRSLAHLDSTHSRVDCRQFYEQDQKGEIKRLGAPWLTLSP